MARDHRIMVRDHDEDDRQGHVVVVHRAHLAARPEPGVHRLAGQQQGHALALVGDDHQQHIGRHDRADDRAHVDEGAAVGEDAGQGEGRADQHQVPDQGEQLWPLAQQLDQHLVDGPAADDEAESGRHRAQRREGHLGGVDQIDRRAPVVEHAQQQEARDPGGVGLPFEPVQVLGHLWRRHEELLALVEAAAVHGPELALDALARRIGRTQVVVQPDEIEGRPDPAHAGHHVQPPQGEVQPGRKVVSHAADAQCTGSAATRAGPVPRPLK